MSGEWFRAECDWPGETVFIVGGGPSVLQQDLTLLEGRRVLAINSSYKVLPNADYVICHDPKWWDEHGGRLQAFAGRIICPQKWVGRCNVRQFMCKVQPPGLTESRTSLTMQMTTFSGAINFAVHKIGRGGRIVLLGADGRMGKDALGREVSHHYATHPWWHFKPGRWPLHHAELKTMVQPLREAGVTVINASPGTAWTDLWPVLPLEQAIDMKQAA